MLAHVLANPVSDDWPRAMANAALGLAAMAVLAGRGSLTLVAALGVVSFVAEAPFVGNHWLIAALLNLVLLGARPGRRAWFERAVPGLATVFLVAYSFAAVAKLNGGFFDGDNSCARFFANQMLGFWQLPELAGGATPILALGTVVIELAIPLLLVVPATRRLGVPLAAGFHLVLTLDLQQHFFDFTLVLLPLFFLFWPSEALVGVVDRFRRAMRADERAWLWLLGLLVVTSTMPIPTVWRGMGIVVTWIVWLWAFVALARAILGGARIAKGSTSPDSVALPSRSAGSSGFIRRIGAVGALAVGLAVLNGLAPYLELKTATGYNMYSNLVTSGGVSNHFLVTSSGELRNAGGDLVVVLDTDSDDLAEYIDSGFALPFVNFTDFLADNPDTSVTYQRLRIGDARDEPVTVERAGDHRALIRSMPWWQEMFATFRAVPLDLETPACQNTWLPAR